MWIPLIVGVAGFASGVLAAVLGVGGAVVTTPLIRALGATPLHAVGSTVPAILPGALSGSLRYHREGFIVWRVALICGGSGMAFAAFGSWVAGEVNAKWLMVVTALLVMWCGVTLVRDAVRNPSVEPDAAGPDAAAPAISTPAPASSAPALPPRSVANVRGGVPAMIALGMGGGFLAGLLGIGGGLILTPGFSLGLRLPVKNTIATALATVAMMSTTAVITHIALGHVDWRFALPLAIGIIPGARVGASITIGTSEQRMRLVSGGLLTVMALVYLMSELLTW